MRTPAAAAAPTIHNTPTKSVSKISAAPPRRQVSAKTKSTTPSSEAAVTIGPSSTIARSIAAKTTAFDPDDSWEPTE